MSAFLGVRLHECIHCLTLSELLLLAATIYTDALLMIYCADQHQEDVSCHVFIVVVGVVTQLGSLATWTLSIGTTGKSTWTAALILSGAGSCLLFLFAGVPVTPFQFKGELMNVLTPLDIPHLPLQSLEAFCHAYWSAFYLALCFMEKTF